MNGEKTKRAETVIGRRALLKALTAVPAAVVVPLSSAPAAGRHEASAGPPNPSSVGATAYSPKVFNDHEWQTIHVLSEMIIPADTRSGGATEAGVPEFIDDWIDFQRGTILAETRGGLTWLDMECNRLFSHDFADCSEVQQKQILDRIAYPQKAAPEDANAVAFFNHLRDLVVSGFFSSKIGIMDLPYLGNTMVADWQGCPPEALRKLGFEPEGRKS